jgi:2-dehydropantoate 2-reductase
MILIVGPGSIGGVLASLWALRGAKVLVLGRSAATEGRLLRHQITFSGPDGRKRPVRGLLSARAHGPQACEAVFFCVKSQDLAAAARAARPWIGPRTAVVGLQNGVDHGAILRRLFGAKRAVAGSCFFSADRPAPFHFSNPGGNEIALAPTPLNGEAAAAARRLLLAGGWRVPLEPREERLLWTKLCFNAATNPLGALCAATNGQLGADPALREIMLTVLKEAVAVARRAGKQPLYSDMAKVVLDACRRSPGQRNSMLQDLHAGRKTELDSIARPLLRAGKRLSVPTPLLEKLSRLVMRLERRT